MKSEKINKLCRVIMVILGALIVFFSADFILSEITDIWAYEDAIVVSNDDWNFSHPSIEYKAIHLSKPLVTTTAFESCSLNLEGMIIRPFSSILCKN